MPSFVAAPVRGHGSWDISEVDAYGMGRCHLSVTYDRTASHKDAEDAARLLVMALSLDGGMKRAAEVLWAELVRQRAE
jgi:hypothetical protein